MKGPEDPLPELVRVVHVPRALPEVDRTQPWPEHCEQDCPPPVISVRFVSCKDRPQDHVLALVIGRSLAHERDHVRPRAELLKERLVILEVDEKVLVLFGFELPCESRTIPISRDAYHDAWPYWPSVWRLLLADQGVVRLDDKWIYLRRLKRRSTKSCSFCLDCVARLMCGSSDTRTLPGDQRDTRGRERSGCATDYPAIQRGVFRSSRIANRVSRCRPFYTSRPSLLVSRVLGLVVGHSDIV